MRFDHGAIDRTRADGNFKFTRQKLELRMIGRPLTNPFRIGPRIGHLV